MTHQASGARKLVRWCAGLSLAAGISHGLNVQEHLREWWGYGAFFLFAAAGQVFFGLILVVQPWRYDETGGLRNGDRYARIVYLTGIVANCFFIALYVITRTVGIPFFGPQAGRLEPLTVLGLATKVLEASLVILLIALLRGMVQRQRQEAH